MDEQFQSLACMQLLMNVVSLAVIDACLKPIKRKDSSRHKVFVAQDKAIDAIMFLMERAEHFVELIGMEGSRFKKELIKTTRKDSTNNITKHLTDEQRRNFRFNHEYWTKNPARRRFLPEEEE